MFLRAVRLACLAHECQELFETQLFEDERSVRAEEVVAQPLPSTPVRHHIGCQVLVCHRVKSVKRFLLFDTLALGLKYE